MNTCLLRPGMPLVKATLATALCRRVHKLWINCLIARTDGRPRGSGSASRPKILRPGCTPAKPSTTEWMEAAPADPMSSQRHEGPRVPQEKREATPTQRPASSHSRWTRGVVNRSSGSVHDLQGRRTSKLLARKQLSIRSWSRLPPVLCLCSPCDQAKAVCAKSPMRDRHGRTSEQARPSFSGKGHTHH